MLLHGCVGTCGKKVWGSQDEEDVCDLCGASRYDDKGKPKEFVVHFPLKERLESLLRCDQYNNAVRWESKRQRVNSSFMTGLSRHLYHISAA